jgi:hypothetical protein
VKASKPPADAAMPTTGNTVALSVDAATAELPALSGPLDVFALLSGVSSSAIRPLSSSAPSFPPAASTQNRVESRRPERFRRQRLEPSPGGTRSSPHELLAVATIRTLHEGPARRRSPNIAAPCRASDERGHALTRHAKVAAGDLPLGKLPGLCRQLRSSYRPSVDVTFRAQPADYVPGRRGRLLAGPDNDLFHAALAGKGSAFVAYNGRPAPARWRPRKAPPTATTRQPESSAFRCPASALSSLRLSVALHLELVPSRPGESWAATTADESSGSESGRSMLACRARPPR